MLDLAAGTKVGNSLEIDDATHPVPGHFRPAAMNLQVWSYLAVDIPCHAPESDNNNDFSSSCSWYIWTVPGSANSVPRNNVSSK